MGESAIIHLGMVKTRAVGSGTMALSVNTFDDLDGINLLGLPLTATSNKVLQRLVNYSAQGIMFRGAATILDDSVEIQDITLFLKQIYTEYPQ